MKATGDLLETIAQSRMQPLCICMTVCHSASMAASYNFVEPVGTVFNITLEYHIFLLYISARWYPYQGQIPTCRWRYEMSSYDKLSNRDVF